MDIREYNLRQSILVAFERTNTEPFDIDNMVNDILTEFKHLSSQDFTTALRKGGLGMYGRTFKLSTQEVCYWLREYQKKKNGLGI